ncbi:MAG: S8 family serine peptidase [Promethearchaeota archaeon]
MNKFYNRKSNHYLGNKGFSNKLIFTVILLSFIVNFNVFKINLTDLGTTILKPSLKDLDIENSEEIIIPFSLLDNYKLFNFDSLEANEWRAKFLSIDKNQNGIHDNLELKLDSLSGFSDTDRNKKLLSKQDVIKKILGNNEIEKKILTKDKIPFIIQFPEGNYEEILSLFSDLGGKVDSTYQVAINGFAGNINHNGFIQFTELLNEADAPYLIEEDSIAKANLYFLSRNLNLRPYVWKNLTNTGDQYSSIVIMDTGIDDSHPLFSPGYSSGNPNYKIVGWNDQVGSSSTPYDNNGHGTHCSGIATGDGTLTLDGNGRTVGTQSIGLDYRGYYTSPGWIDITGARFEVNQPGTIEIDCRFNDYTPGSDYIYLYAYIYHDESSIVSYTPTSSSWTHTLSYVVTSGNEGDYSLRYRLYFGDGNSDGYVDDPYLALRGIIHWPFDPLLLDGGEPWRGVAPDARLVGVKVLDGTGSGTSTQLLNGIDWVINNKNTYNITTISLSLGFGGSVSSIISAVNNAVENGIVVVASAGNDGPGGNNIGSPGDAPNVITVAASAYDDRVTSYSSQGSSSKPDIMAPGGSFYNFTMFSADSGDSDADNEYTDGYPNDLASAQGTSMSCPAVAGATNLMIEAMGGHQNWGYTAVEAKRVKAMLLMTATETFPLIREQSTASYSPLLNRGGRDAHEGYGRMNIDAAIEAYTNILNPGGQKSAILASSIVDPYNKHALGCYVNLVSGTNYKFKLDVPDGSDFDLHLYSNTPSSIGLPIMEDSSISSVLGSDENIEFTATTTGKYYLIAKAISGKGNATIEYLQNTYPPMLTNEHVSPKVGNQATFFNFSVTYTDLDDYGPSYINVSIDGAPYAMTKVNPLDDNYIDGCVYQYNTYLQPSINNYTYSFECSDGTFTNSTSSYNDVNVSEVNDFAPILTNGQVSPLFGRNSSTVFTFLVNYTDYDNSAPLYVYLTLNSTIYSMNKQNLLDNFYIDGCIYTYSTTLDDIGEYVFSFNTTDGTYITNIGPFFGPTVEESNLKNYYMDVGYNYNWIDATGGTSLSVSDDGYSTQTLPFDFTFYNETYSTIYVGANGYLSFTDSSPSYTGGAIPSSNIYHTYLIAPFWDDLRTSYGGGAGDLYVQSFGTYWVAEWYNINHYGGNLAGTFQVILFESGDIIFNYDYLSNVLSGYACGLNLGVDINYYNSYQGLSSGINDFAILFTYQGNDYAPVLSSGTVTPKEGNQLTPFTFSTIYTDADNNDPLYVNVLINGTSYLMQQEDPLDTDYTDGVLFQYSTLVQSSAYNYTYSFECADRDYSNSSLIYNDLKVDLVNYNAPRLINPQVSPTIGGNDINFYFSVEYFDDDNNLPSFVNLIINNSMIYSMLPANPSDTYAIDGIQYYYETPMDFGYYQFLINCSDNSFSISTGWIDGPEVNPFLSLSSFIIFEDDFERSSLGSDWTLTGYGGINSMTYNSYYRSAYHCGDTGSITSRIIPTSSYAFLNLSFWVRQGSSDFSELPDSNENLIAEFYDASGSWVILDTFYGGSPGGVIYSRSYELPRSASHSNFRFRFRQTYGSGIDYDYWHIDDVILTNDYIRLEEPSSLAIFDNSNPSYVTFQWGSLGASFGPVNYTIQISSNSDFSNLIYERTDIVEGYIVTNCQILIDFEANVYYWRVRPTYGEFAGSWTEIGNFIVIGAGYSSPPQDPIVILIIIIAIIGIAIIITTAGYVYNKKSKQSKIKKLDLKPISPKDTVGTSYTQHDTLSLQLELENLKKMKNVIETQLMSPHTRASPAGQTAIRIANSSILQFKSGNINKGLEAMILALKMGVPEPENGIIKTIVLDFIDKKIESISQKEIMKISCPKCKAMIDINQKACDQCGNIIEKSPTVPISQPLIKICPNCGKHLKELTKFCIKCGTRVDTGLEKKYAPSEISDVKESDVERIIKCHKCNASLPSGVHFCIHCGTKIETIVDEKPNISTISISPIPKEIEEKPDESSEKYELTCPHCNSLNPSDSLFCVKCGKSIKNDNQSQSNASTK